MPRLKDGVPDRQLVGLAGPNKLPENLPLVHITAVWPAKEIVERGSLNTSKCDVFSAELLYFFVMRPAYRLRYGNIKSHQISRFPVAFIFRNSAVDPPYHVYPFDTGAAARGAFDNKADPYIPLEYYELEPTHAGASDLIGWAFGNLESYFEGRLRDGLQEEVPAAKMVISGYLDIARMGVEMSNDHDKRSCTVEMASSRNLDLRNNLRLAIFPKQFLEKNRPFVEELRNLQANGAHFKFYDWQPNRTPDDYQSELMQICRDWYRRQEIMR